MALASRPGIARRIDHRGDHCCPAGALGLVWRRMVLGPAPSDQPDPTCRFIERTKSVSGLRRLGARVCRLGLAIRQMAYAVRTAPQTGPGGRNEWCDRSDPVALPVHLSAELGLSRRDLTLVRHDPEVTE